VLSKTDQAYRAKSARTRPAPGDWVVEVATGASTGSRCNVSMGSCSMRLLAAQPPPVVELIELQTTCSAWNASMRGMPLSTLMCDEATEESSHTGIY
jgi:hypothetical protein